MYSLNNIMYILCYHRYPILSTCPGGCNPMAVMKFECTRPTKHYRRCQPSSFPVICYSQRIAGPNRIAENTQITSVAETYLINNIVQHNSVKLQYIMKYDNVIHVLYLYYSRK